ncbi:trans-sialidase [Trypanosoma cruzi]|nr:trans-sialidase [Trypanosoma cruzi]
MSRRLLNSAALLLLFVLFCRGVDASGGAGEQMESKEVELFKPGEVTVPAAEEGRETFDGYSLVLSIHGHSLVDVNGAMLALAIGEYDESYDGMYYNILAKYNSYGDVSNLEKDVTWAAKQWTPKTVFEQFKKGGYRTFLFGPKAVAKANKIFLLLSNFTEQSSVPLQTSYSWDLELFVGDVTASTAVPGGKTVSWEGPRSLKSTLLTLMGKHSWNVLEAARGARGIAVGGTTVVFPLVAVSEKAEKGREPAQSSTPRTMGTLGHFRTPLRLLMTVWISLSSSGRGNFSWSPRVLLFLSSSGCTNPLTWGRHGQRWWGHFHAC